MSGPEHYRMAEALLEVRPLDEGHVAAAQVHATLALAAAQVEAVASRAPGDITHEWRVLVYGEESTP